MPSSSAPRVALIIPCYNEAAAIAQVIADFRQAIPDIKVHVFDNDSSDQTRTIAQQAGARVTTVRNRGKGHVVRRMFADVEADYYIMVDGDDTYDASLSSTMLQQLIDDRLDMMVGCRHDDGSPDRYRAGHRLGNRLLTGAVRHVFGGTFTDMLSGYRVLSRRYVKSFPSQSVGFEIETELTVHALEMAMPCGEIATPYKARPEGSSSKLRTYHDGARILATILRLYMFERPLPFFSLLGTLLVAAALVLAIPLFINFYEVGLVPRLPTAVLVTGMCVVGLLLFASGVILDSVTRARREMRRFMYLSIPLFRY